MEDGEIADGSPIEYTYSHKQYPERCHTEHHTVLANGRRDRTAKGRLHSERHDRHSRERERDSKRRRQHESSHRESSSYSRKRHDSSRYTDHDNHGKRRDSTTSSTRHTRDTLLLATNTTTTNTSAKPKDGNDSTTTTTVPSSLLQVVSKSPLVLTKPRDSSSSCASVEKQEETCVVSLENEDKAESEADEEDFLMESPAEREERLIQEARQRRLAILAKHNNTNQQSRPDTPMMSKEDSVDPSVAIITDSPIPFFDLSKDMSSTTVTTVTGGQEITMNAAEYDPEMDAKREWAQRQEKKGLDVHQVHHQQAVPVVESAPTKEDVQKQEQQLENKVTEEDMFAPEDDMFAPTFDATLLKQSDKAIATAHILESAPVLRASNNPLLVDNWDDSEGYYRIIMGEVLHDRYHVYSHLGRGVFSSVVKASDTLTSTDVAIKIIRNNELMYRAGKKELEILTLLRDLDPEDKKHVVKHLGSFEHKNHLCIVFESLSMDLRSVVKKFGKENGLNIQAVKVYAQQLLHSLTLLKKANLIHSDIKPDNILVSESKAVLKLCDLGSAMDASENEVTPYLVSRFYRAPEVILGIPYDYAIDMWSVGTTLYELYTGKVLFPGSSNNMMLKLMMDLKGKIPHKVLKKGAFIDKHFDEKLDFVFQDVDKISGNLATRTISNFKPSSDLKSRLLSNSSSMAQDELRTVTHFVDFLDKALNLNPDKRLSVKEALVHPFVYGKMGRVGDVNGSGSGSGGAQGKK